MSGKLDQSLDAIISTQRRSTGATRRRSTRRPAGKATTTAPVGGVQKNKQNRNVGNKQAPAKANAGNGVSKVVVSNLPKDVSENQIKEYFTSAVGPIKRVEIAYGPGGASRGMATITFVRPEGASVAFNKLNGILIDGKPIKIEIVVSADKAAAIAPAPKTLTERVSQPKAQPKSAANDKKKDAGNAAGAGGRRGKKRGAPRSSRPAKKTAEELDSEMNDYFEAGNQSENTGATNGAATTNGDAAMDDGIL